MFASDDGDITRELQSCPKAEALSQSSYSQTHLEAVEASNMVET